jgi:small ligand-binding sensory domain FIST
MSDQATASPANSEQLTPARAAIARCCAAYEQTRRAALEKKRGDSVAHFLASESYRKAMPQLADPASVPVFIACVAHGMLIDTIENAQGTRLLYAARTAQAAFRNLAAAASNAA